MSAPRTLTRVHGLPAGLTSENVSSKYGIPREAQDKMAARSHARAAAATASGRFKNEIVPVHTMWKDPKTGEEKKLVVNKDDGVRPGISAQQLAALKPVFKKGGSTTAGNSSQVPVSCNISVFPCFSILS